jgi:hypothetical protein
MLILCMSFCHAITGQSIEKPPVDGNIIAGRIGLGGQIPGGDLKDRYGANLNFVLGTTFLNKKDWYIEPEFQYLYGDVIKEDILKPFRTKEGLLLGDDEQIAEVKFRQRGIFVGAMVGKIIRVSPLHRSGFSIGLGGGVLAHQIIFSDNGNALAQIRIGRTVGYDRLTRGPALKQSIGYKLFSANRSLNLEVSLDFMQGFTKEVRAINFDTGLPTLGNRLDLLHGIRLLWTFPYYRGGNEATIYY